MKHQTNSIHLRIRALCEGAMMLALAQVLGYLKLYTLPNGGSVTLGMFPILLFALRWGFCRGVVAGLGYGLLQLLLDGAYAWGWQSMVLDYLLAYAPLGLAGCFRGKAWGIFPGAALGCLARFGVHYLSGVTIYRIYAPTEIPGFGTFSNAEVYSLVYNALYVLPSALLALAMAGILYVPLNRYLAGGDIQ